MYARFDLLLKAHKSGGNREGALEQQDTVKLKVFLEKRISGTKIWLNFSLHDMIDKLPGLVKIGVLLEFLKTLLCSFLSQVLFALSVV